MIEFRPWLDQQDLQQLGVVNDEICDATTAKDATTIEDSELPEDGDEHGAVDDDMKHVSRDTQGERAAGDSTG